MKRRAEGGINTQPLPVSDSRFGELGALLKIVNVAFLALNACGSKTIVTTQLCVGSMVRLQVLVC